MVLGELIVETATLDLWNLVLWVGASDLIGPLHLLSLNHQSANLLLAILSWRERNNEISTVFAVGFKDTLFGVDVEFGGRVKGEVGLELGWLFHVVRQSERH